MYTRPIEAVQVEAVGRIALTIEEYGKKYSVHCTTYDTSKGTYYMPYKGHHETGTCDDISEKFCKELLRNEF